MYRKLAVLLPFLFLLTATGALGLKTLQNCTDTYVTRFSDKIHCYHEAAITYAYVGAPGDAETACDKITELDDGGDKDLQARAEIERNACYYDIAKIIARNNPDEDVMRYCDNIEQSEYGTVLKGAKVTKETCQETVTRIRTQKDYIGNPNNFCSIFFILPLLVFAAFMKR